MNIILKKKKKKTCDFANKTLYMYKLILFCMHKHYICKNIFYFIYIKFKKLYLSFTNSFMWLLSYKPINYMDLALNRFEEE